LIIAALFIAFAVALVVLIAILQDVIWPLIVGFVIVAVALITAAAAIVNKVAVPFMAARLKYVDVQLEHERRMLELRLRHTPALPKPAQAVTVHPEVEPYRNLAIELIAVTRDLLGDDATRIASREKAQPYGSFRNHRQWEQAVSFLTAYGLVYQMVSGGKSEGTVIGKGRTAAELAQMITPPALM
jgi:hypothetical protein